MMKFCIICVDEKTGGSFQAPAFVFCQRCHKGACRQHAKWVKEEECSVPTHMIER